MCGIIFFLKKMHCTSQMTNKPMGMRKMFGARQGSCDVMK